MPVHRDKSDTRKESPVSTETVKQATRASMRLFSVRRTGVFAVNATEETHKAPVQPPPSRCTGAKTVPEIDYDLRD